MTPQWLQALAWASLAVGVVSAALVAHDITVRGYRQQLPIMDWVWPITALYFGPLGLWAYRHLGRPRSTRADENPSTRRAAPAWHSGSLSASHCGAGCVIGDIIGGWTVYAAALTIAGASLYPDYILEFALAWGFGIAFQYFSIKPMHPDLATADALRQAIKADTLSIVAFEVGMFAWMAVAAKVLFTPPPEANSPVFWFMMQIGLVLGFLTTYPVNRWLVRAGIKNAM